MKREFENVTTVIRQQKGWKLIDLHELIRYKDLLYFLTIRGVKAKYAQSVLGVGWAIIQPLFSTLVFTVVFGNLAKINSEGVPYFIFSMVALVPWTYFSGTLTESDQTNARLRYFSSCPTERYSFCQPASQIHTGQCEMHR